MTEQDPTPTPEPTPTPSPAPAPAKPAERAADVAGAVNEAVQQALAPIQRQLEDEKLARKHGLSDDQLLAVNEVRQSYPNLPFEKAVRLAQIEKPDTFQPPRPAFDRGRHGVMPPGGDSPARRGEPGKQETPDHVNKMREAAEANKQREATFHAHQEFARRIGQYSTTLQKPRN